MIGPQHTRTLCAWHRRAAAVRTMLWRWRVGVALASFIPSSTAAVTPSAGQPGTITIDADSVVTELPPEMSGAGCGIEYLNHEIDGGLYSQLVLDESFEYAYNARASPSSGSRG
jgi:hypothetical protein